MSDQSVQWAKEAHEAELRTKLAAQAKAAPLRVTVTDLDVSFGAMVWLLIKLALASLPATFIVVLFLFGVSSLMLMFLGGLGGLLAALSGGQ